MPFKSDQQRRAAYARKTPNPATKRGATLSMVRDFGRNAAPGTSLPIGEREAKLQWYKHHATGRTRLEVITPDGWYSDSPVRYENGELGWDRPGLFPADVRKAAKIALQAKHDAKVT